MKVQTISRAAALFLTLLLLAGCAGGDRKETPSPAEPFSRQEESSSLPPESLEFEGDHDHTGIPGLDLPESLPVGDYAFEAYDSSAVQVATMAFTLDGEAVDAIVLSVPAGTRNFLESYADGVVVSMARLDGSEGAYIAVPLGSLTGEDQWEAGEHPLKNGDRYDITFGEAGFFRMDIRDSAGNTDTYWFSVTP